MNKQEWKEEYRQKRIEVRVGAQKIFEENPEIQTVYTPFIMPISGNCNWDDLPTGIITTKRENGLDRE